MRIGHIELFVTNPKASLEFYQDVLGFELVHNQDNQFIWVKLGGFEILLRPGTDVVHSKHFRQSASNIVLYTEDLPETKNELVKRGLIFKGDDAGCPLFTDPDGHWFQLVNPEGS